MRVIPLILIAAVIIVIVLGIQFLLCMAQFFCKEHVLAAELETKNSYRPSNTTSCFTPFVCQ